MLDKRTSIIDINGIMWTIIRTDEPEKLLMNNKRLKGVTVYKDNTVYINDELIGNRLNKVLLHELSHIYIYETQIEMKEFYDEEMLCDFMAKFGNQITDKAKRIMSDFKL